MMDGRVKESKSAATIRRRTNRNGASLSDLLGYRHKSAGSSDDSLDSDDDDIPMPVDEEAQVGGPKIIRLIMSSPRPMFLGLLAFRLLNAMMIQTSYVPDEYWQSVEVAHNMAFGYPFSSVVPLNLY